jgi:hypothetical protein
MRFIKFDELMTMPAGTIYQKYDSECGGLGPPLVFGEPIRFRDRKVVNYAEADFLPTLGFTDSLGHLGKQILQERGLLDAIQAVWYPSGYGRNGVFEKSVTFLLWEEADRRRFAEWLLDHEKLANELNDDDVTIAHVPDITK